MDYRWNGEPCEAEGVFIEIKDSPSGEGDFFKWWKLYIGKVVEGLRVQQGDSVFYIYNGDKSGERKLLAGGGPNMGHIGFDHFEVWDSSEGLEVVKINDCYSHTWSQTKEPIFQTETQYCLNCRKPKIFEDI